jgi:hypothetical protein
VQNSIHSALDENIVSYVVLDETETLVASQVRDVVRGPCAQVVHRNNSMVIGQQPVTQMRTDKTRAAGN